MPVQGLDHGLLQSPLCNGLNEGKFPRPWAFNHWSRVLSANATTSSNHLLWRCQINLLRADHKDQLIISISSHFCWFQLWKHIFQSTSNWFVISSPSIKTSQTPTLLWELTYFKIKNFLNWTMVNRTGKMFETVQLRLID